MKTFDLNDEEEKEALAFMEEHKKVCPHSFANGNLPATGEHYYYKFIPGGLGASVLIGCVYCNVEKDITDVSCW